MAHGPAGKIKKNGRMQKSITWRNRIIYPLVNVYITNWKDPPFSIGNFHYFDWAMASSSQTVSHYQRVSVVVKTHLQMVQWLPYKSNSSFSQGWNLSNRVQPFDENPQMGEIYQWESGPRFKSAGDASEMEMFCFHQLGIFQEWWLTNSLCPIPYSHPGVDRIWNISKLIPNIWILKKSIFDLHQDDYTYKTYIEIPSAHWSSMLRPSYSNFEPERLERSRNVCPQCAAVFLYIHGYILGQLSGWRIWYARIHWCLCQTTSNGNRHAPTQGWRILLQPSGSPTAIGVFADGKSNMSWGRLATMRFVGFGA